MPGLVPGIHVFSSVAARKTWMAGSSPAMTKRRTRKRIPRRQLRQNNPTGKIPLNAAGKSVL
jgi:hypothetical protein